MELIFLNLFHMRDTHNDFQLPSTKTEILVQLGQSNPPETLPWGGGRGGIGDEKLNFLDLLHMRNIHTNFQLPTSKTDLTYNRSEMGAILPPETLLLGELGGG